MHWHLQSVSTQTGGQIDVLFAMSQAQGKKFHKHYLAEHQTLCRVFYSWFTYEKQEIVSGIGLMIFAQDIPKCIITSPQCLFLKRCVMIRYNSIFYNFLVHKFIIQQCCF